MVRWITSKLYAPDLHYIEAAGLSTDNKPAGNLVTGSVFIEVDTGKAYFYDEESSAWIEAGGDNNG